MANKMTTNDPEATREPAMGERAGQVAGTAREEVQNVAGDARQEMSAVASEAATQARNVMDESRSALRSQARQGTERTAGAIDTLSSQVRALASGDREGAGDLGRYADQVGDRLHTLAERISSRGFDGVVDDVQAFGRRRPGLFLAIAAGAGFAAGRLFRGAQAASSTPSASGPGHGEGAGALSETYTPTASETGARLAGTERGTTPEPDLYGGASAAPAPGVDPRLGETGIGR